MPRPQIVIQASVVDASWSDSAPPDSSSSIPAIASAPVAVMQASSRSLERSIRPSTNSGAIRARTMRCHTIRRHRRYPLLQPARDNLAPPSPVIDLELFIAEASCAKEWDLRTARLSWTRDICRRCAPALSACYRCLRVTMAMTRQPSVQGGGAVLESVPTRRREVCGGSCFGVAARTAQSDDGSRP